MGASVARCGLGVNPREVCGGRLLVSGRESVNVKVELIQIRGEVGRDTGTGGGGGSNGGDGGDGPNGGGGDRDGRERGSGRSGGGLFSEWRHARAKVLCGESICGEP